MQTSPAFAHSTDKHNPKTVGDGSPVPLAAKMAKTPGFPTKKGTQGHFCSLCDYLHPIWSIPLPGGVGGKHIAQIPLLTNVSAESGRGLTGQLFEATGEIELVAETQLRTDLPKGQMGIHHQLGGSVNKLAIHILAYG